MGHRYEEFAGVNANTSENADQGERGSKKDPTCF